MNEIVSTAQTTASSIQQGVDVVKDSLIPFFDRLSTLAEAANQKLLKLLWLNLASACWLSYFVYWLFEFSVPGLTPIFIAFIIPTLFIWKLYGTLTQVISIPGQLLAMGDNLKQLLAQSKSDTQQRLSQLNAQEPSSNKITALIGMIRQLVSQGKLLKDLTTEFAKTGKQDLIEAVVLVASPQFAILMSIATIGTITSVVLSVLTGIGFLIFH